MCKTQRTRPNMWRKKEREMMCSKTTGGSVPVIFNCDKMTLAMFPRYAMEHKLDDDCHRAMKRTCHDVRVKRCAKEVNMTPKKEKTWKSRNNNDSDDFPNLWG